ncbi:hypothetical protein K9U39_05440 [Rhodoblastus acidophilus]|uniref:Uncharacterized protein n=1 Tax=Candidatus Rhodoblastus alkanivorans TaxID=2954117 RepID=A0ABS9Z6S7_9HYPH|nr:hypothetical protein [Candidatus Rhodoblastus alkanivorans]MCI4678676.1 hypothetical protein [Candidatus Rhodoblastus alkanivorans]MCI4683085.1 hypothetical protein [Candidatus Rhodoblastus alkanivorans]MDI4640396.1 hypothetical protein [Rhodoblastus acidophilus]
MRQASAAKITLYGVEALDERRAMISSLAQAGRNLAPAEVRQLRRALFEDEGVSRDEAQALFDLDRVQDAPCAEWTEFFVECLTDHAVWQCRPTGIVSDGDAEWLVREADRCRPVTGVALLANVLAEAHRAPPWLVAAVRARVQMPEIQAELAREA